METLRYFGRIYGMDSSDVRLRAKFIISLLDLPSDKSRLIRNLRYRPRSIVSILSIHMLLKLSCVEYSLGHFS